MNKTLALVIVTLLTASTLPLTASADASQDIPANASATGVHNSLVAALTHANLVATLQGTGPFTVFAPTDQAFTDAGINLNDFDTPEENATLSKILLHHVISGEVASTDLSDGMLATTVNNDRVKFGVTTAGVTVDGANVTTADVQASNGIIHVIDKVLLPPGDIPTIAQSTGIHNSLVAAVVQADLLTTFQGAGPFTLFAPTDQAFTDAGVDLADFNSPEGKAALANILKHHVIDGDATASTIVNCGNATMLNGQDVGFSITAGGVMVNDANVVLADVVASNGIIHVIDKVLTPSDEAGDIPRTAGCTGAHNSLVAAVVQAGLLETLQGPGPFTVFAPTDQAFADANINLADFTTSEGLETLADILKYHVVAGEVPAANVSDCMEAATVNGNPLAFAVDGGVMVNDANVTQADVPATNGVIHVIDKVLMPNATPKSIPQTAHCNGNHSALVAAVVQANLLDTLSGPGPFTVFAPTDQAFADANIDLADFTTPEGLDALADILRYHVVVGNVPSSALSDCMQTSTVNGKSLAFTVGDDGVFVNDASVTTADVNTSNGVIHIIDKVLLPTDTPNDIPRVAQCDGNFGSLVAAVVQAELLATLQGDGPFTVFAPTDQAFANANIDLADFDTPAGKIELRNILLYHVIEGAVPAANVSECMVAPSVNGNPLAFTVGAGGVQVNDANVTATDIAGSNGIIHVIDKVLMPTATPNDIPRTAACTGSHTTLVDAVIQAGLLSTLQSDGPFTVFAPTDQAFADKGIDLAALDTPSGVAALEEILLAHVVAGTVPAANISNCDTLATANGFTLSFNVGETVSVNGATVTGADAVASNGIIHVIDKVLDPVTTPNDIPATAGCTGAHGSLVAAVIQAELLETLQGDGPFTIFAPTDQAFADAGVDLADYTTAEGKANLAEILRNHVVVGELPAANISDCAQDASLSGHVLAFSVSDGTVMVNGATVSTADVATSNGIIHVVDKVLLPNNTPNDIVRTAQCTGSHASLVAALGQAELVEALQAEGPFTVFAPTDQAFTDAGINLANYTTPEGKEELIDLLKFHVYVGTLLSSNIENGASITMLNGDNATFTSLESLEGATIVTADVQTANGVIHVIDKVLIPPTEGAGDGSSDASSTASDADEEGLDWVLIGGVVLVVVIAGLVVARFARRSGEDVETPKDFTGTLQNTTGTETTSTGYDATTGYAAQATSTGYQQQTYQQQAYQAAVAQPAATQIVDDSALNALVEPEPVADPVAATQPVQAAQPVQATQPAVAQPVAAPAVAPAEPKVVNQWTDDNGHTWRVMSDSSYRWWNGTDWQKV